MIAKYLLIFFALLYQSIVAGDPTDSTASSDNDSHKSLIFEDSLFDALFEPQNHMNNPPWLDAFTVRITHQLFGQINNHAIGLPTGRRYQKKSMIEHNRTGLNIRYSNAFAPNWLLQGSWQARVFWNQDYEYDANKKNIDTEYRINELFLQRTLGRHSLKFGRQTLVWGETVGNSVLDVINHTEYRDFSIIDIEDARLNQWMLVWDFFNNQSQLSGFLNLYPEFNPSPVEGSPLHFALPINLRYTQRNSNPIFEAGARWSKSYEKSDIAFMGAYLWENQLQYRSPTEELMESSGIKNDFYLLGFSTNYAWDRILLTLDISLNRGVFPDRSFFVITPLENTVNIKKDQVGISFGFEYGISATQDLSLSAKMEKILDEGDGLHANHALIKRGIEGTWLLRYNSRPLDRNTTFSGTLQGDLDGNAMVVSLRSNYAFSDQIEIGCHMLYIAANRDSRMALFDRDLRLGASITYYF